MDLSDAMRYDGVQLDSCLLEERTRGAVLPDDQELEPTPNPSHSAVTPPTQLNTLAPQSLTVQYTLYYTQNTQILNNTHKTHSTLHTHSKQHTYNIIHIIDTHA